MLLLLIFVIVPIIEIALFIQVGGAIGLWPTLAIVILTALVGTTLMRRQGLGALADLQGSLQGGKDPTAALAHGALILVAGVLLLTPGFFTDAVGLCLLVPPIRALVIARAAAALKGRVTIVGAQTARPQGQGDVIDGEFEELDDEPPSGPKSGPPSGWTNQR